MIKVKDGYGKLIGTTYQGSADHLLRSNGDTWAVHTGRNNEANKIVRTDSNGQLQVGWINTTSGNLGTANITRIYCSNDDYIRYKTPENFFSTLSNNGDNISITIASQNRTLVVGYSKVAGQLRSKGTISPQTGRTQSLGDVYSYHLNGSVSGGPTKYASVIGFGRGTSGTVEIAGEWTSGRGLWVRALRDTTDNWYAWDKVLTQATYTGITDSRYYTKTQADERFVNITGDTMTGELINSSANAYRLKQSNYGVILRNDNNSFWILLTNSGSPSGSYNSLRPFRINLPDGRVTIGNGLSVTGTIVGSSTIQGTQLISTIADGTAPLKVTSKTVVTNLNSDLLDGYHETSFFRARGSQTIASSIPTTTELSSNNNLSGNWNVTYSGASGHLVQFNTGSGSTRYMQFYSYYSGSLYWRNSTDSTLNTKSWKTILDNNNYSSTLDGRYVTLATNQTVSGIKTFSTQQKFTVATGTSPFTVSSTTVVSNLNADLLDGWHLNYILKDGYVTSATSGLSSYWRKVWDITLNNQYNDVDINLLVHSAYNQQWGIISFRLRQDGTGTAKNISAYLAEVVGNIPLDRFRLYYNNSSGLCQLWCNPSGQYGVYNYRVLAKTWRTGTEAATLGTFYTGNTSTAQSLPSDSYVSMAGITIVNTAAKVANTLTFSAGKFSSKTYNGSSAITVNVPTHTSHLTNDSGFWTGTRYWANIAVSTSSSTSTSPTFSTAYTSNWFRSTGATGWYSQTYGGGWYMSDSTWIRTFGSKSVYQNTGQIRTDGYLVTNGGLTAGATSPNNGTYKLYVTGASWSSGLIRAGGGFYHNSVNSNSYVLLAGGSYKGLGDFAKGNAGSATKGVYVTGGTVTAMTYSLSSNLNSGTSGKLAYYSSATTVAAYSSSVGASNRGVYMNAGVPTVMAYYLNATVNSGTSGKLAYYSSATTVAAYSSSVGASNRGVYMNAGVPTVMAYYLNATVNSGTSGKLAYYSDSNTLRSYTSTVGSAAQPIYLNAGSPSASSYSFTGTYSNPVIVWCGEIYRSTPGSTYWYSVKKGGCCSISFTTNNAGSNGNLIISIPHCEPYAAFCSTVRIFDGSTAISAGDGTIHGRSAGMGDYMTICGIRGTTGNVYIRKFSQQNKENDSWRNGELGTTTTSNGNKPVARFYLMIVGRYI